LQLTYDAILPESILGEAVLIEALDVSFDLVDGVEDVA